jgi:transposase
VEAKGPLGPEAHTVLFRKNIQNTNSVVYSSSSTKLDLSAFDAAFHNDHKGAPAYFPQGMLKIIFSCYSRGIITSRPIA